MQFVLLITALLAIPFSVASLVDLHNLPQVHEVPRSVLVPGLGLKKQAYLAHGVDADILGLSIALLQSQYLRPASSGTGDSARWGLWNQSWKTLRTYAKQFQGQGPEDYMNGAALNSDFAADMLALNNALSDLGSLQWVAEHLGMDIASPEVKHYGEAIMAVQLWFVDDVAHQSDDMYFVLKKAQAEAVALTATKE